MDIFELRGYIGPSELLFTQTFSTLDAAINKAVRLNNMYKDTLGVNGEINKLTLRGEAFEFHSTEYRF